MDPITCARAHPFIARADGLFACVCGELLAAADVEPDSGRTWAVDDAGGLVVLDHPGAALARLREAVEDLRDAPSYPRPDIVRQGAVRALREALGVLREAAAHGIRP